MARLNQTNQSDINFLSRLEQLFDAMATVKEGHIIFTTHGTGTSVSGAALAAITLKPADVTSLPLRDHYPGRADHRGGACL